MNYTAMVQEAEDFDQEVQQIRILLERRQDSIRRFAEELIGFNERLDSFKAEISVQLDHLKVFIISLVCKDLHGHVKLLESWKERSERDPVEIVKERYGIPKTGQAL